MVAPLSTHLRSIRNYARAHRKFRRATIFSFDVRLPKFRHRNVPEFISCSATRSRDVDVVVFGINEAEYPIDRKIRSLSAHVLEDTSELDFRARPGLLAECAREKAQKWYQDVRKCVGPKTSVILGELFFWSSANEVHLERFYGKIGSPSTFRHFAYCRTQNEQLLRHYRPKIVVVSGSEIRRNRLIINLYKLKRPHLDRDAILMGIGKTSYYCDPTGRLWVFSPHFKSGRGIRDSHRAELMRFVKREIAQSRTSV